MSWSVLGLADEDLAHIYFTRDDVGDEGIDLASKLAIPFAQDPSPLRICHN
ncbi:hypothetical protein IQ229_07445 [Nostoc cf. edaphicum LEGE 07299]|uniref:DUF2283 domain-containing protein n=1 Tax=Nostoc cf. edaphicum LEGE 07299 TaxID=2777974 RepID=A0ABR9TWJ8_9NOSO|nr:hypothetical protein [Nostoc edaphicum]MBE9104779.1 hypothetical protein [Nostoc cf. edaphicum LEGE 07299]